MAKLQRGTTFVNGNTYQGNDLNNLVDNAQVLPGIITEQSSKSVPTGADQLLISDNSDSDALKRITIASLSTGLGIGRLYYGLTDTGSANNYAFATNPVTTSYLSGDVFVGKFANLNNGTSQINLNTLGNKNIFKNGVVLIGGEIPANASVAMQYDGTQWNIIDAGIPNKSITNAQIANSTITGGLIASGYTFLKMTTYTSGTATWTPDASTRASFFQAQGAGGGGGGINSSAGSIRAGGGGGQGGYSQRFMTSGFGPSQLVTVGTGGTAGANTGGTGGTGGTSSVGSLLTATGGVGGVGANGAVVGDGGNGGTGSTGDFNKTGQGGGVALVGSNATSSGFGGGEGGGKGFAATNGDGQNGSNGGGGSGALGVNTTARVGGTGGNGYVIVTEYA